MLIPYRCHSRTHLCFCCLCSTASRRRRSPASYQRNVQPVDGSAAHKGWLRDAKGRDTTLCWMLHNNQKGPQNQLNVPLPSAHLCWWPLPTGRTCPCMARCWSDHTGCLWRWAGHEHTGWCCRSCTSVSLPNNTSLRASDCWIVRDGISVRLIAFKTFVMWWEMVAWRGDVLDLYFNCVH